MIFRANLKNYEIIEIPKFIHEVSVNDIDFDDLSNEINEFKKEIEWDEMWDINEAKMRFSEGWKIIIYKPELNI